MNIVFWFMERQGVEQDIVVVSSDVVTCGKRPVAAAGKTLRTQLHVISAFNIEVDRLRMET